MDHEKIQRSCQIATFQLSVNKHDCQRVHKNYLPIITQSRSIILIHCTATK